MKNPDASDPAPVESSQYYYHADRLGSSNFVTDASGKIFQHVEYFPFGETWVDEHSNTHRTPYLFTGKQFDETTDLYYYGARYYDPRTSVWQSSDPQLVASPDVSVGDPSLLNAYAYAAQNPVLNIDPNGDVTTPVSYFTDPHAAWARDQRANGNVNGRNLATVKYRITNGIGAGTKGHHTLISSGKHSETRLKAWLEANYPGRYEVLWLYTELEPCGSNVHNCRNKVSGWNWSAKGERVFYSIDYPNEEDVSDTEPSGAMRNAARKRKLAQDRRSVGPQNLKRFQSQLKRRKLNGQPLNVVPVFNPPLRPITPRGGNNL
jgi:RHS repeat-associated protein